MLLEECDKPMLLFFIKRREQRIKK